MKRLPSTLLALLLGLILSACYSTAPIIPTSTPPPAGLTPAPPVTAILDFSFVNERLGWLLAESCEAAGSCSWIVLASGDGGQTWQLRAALPEEAAIDAGNGRRPGISFADGQTGWVYGTETWVTHDGGASWAPEDLAGPLAALESAGGSAWAVTGECAAPGACGYTLHVWSSASRTWSTAPTQPTFSSPQFQFIHPTAEDAAILNDPGAASAAEGPLFITHDGGRTWNSASMPCAPASDPAGANVGSPDGHRLWVICSGGQGAKSFYFSNDGGLTWSPEAPFSASGSITDMEIISVHRGFLGMQNGPLMGTFDGGLAWGPVVSLEENAAEAYTWEVEFTNTLFGWAAAGERFFRTTDGGNQWVPIELP